MDINRHNFISQKDAVVDLIALRFGVVRAGGAKETWHFELSDLGISSEEKRVIEQEER
jgi:hypothetical protein